MQLREKIQKQAQIIAKIRQYFLQHPCLEVRTDVITQYPTAAPYISSFQINATDYLRSSPEVAMQTLIWQGVGDIYQIGPAFRQGESGRLHNEEFMLLEWYRTNGKSLQDLTHEMIAICQLALPAAAIEEHNYFDLFQQHCNIDLTNLPIPQLKAMVQELNGTLQTNDITSYLDQIINLSIVPKLSRNTLHAISMYPAIDREYARVNQQKTLAYRCEIWYNEVELANGCLEVQSSSEYRSIFASELRTRSNNGAPLPNMPDQLLRAMDNAVANHQNNDFCGAALGLDRLLMLSLGIDDINRLSS